MFSSPLELFKALTQIPHSSGDTTLMQKFLIQSAQSFGALVSVDSAGNILCQKGDSPRFCLQAHYDMVCVGKAPEIELFEEGGWLRAKDSSLGADNGAALACFLILLKQESSIEILFTNDEEIGMLGAKALELTPSAPLILNVDSESLQEVVISCAGGYDLELEIPATFKETPAEGYLYELSTQNFLGGHSGIDIIKNHPNALVEMAHLLASLPVEILSFEGGEKSNSIPVHAKASLFSSRPLEHLPSWIRATARPLSSPLKALDQTPLLDLLRALHSGIFAYDEESSGVLDSLNISLLKAHEKGWTLTLMGRANDKERLWRNLERARLIARAFRIKEDRLKDFYPPWEKAKSSSYLEKIKEVYERELGVCHVRSIHAGLECAVLQEKLPKAEFISIGPTILHPHSTREALDIKSFERFWEILQIITKVL